MFVKNGGWVAQKTELRRSNTEMLEDVSGERGCISRVTGLGELVSGAVLGCERTSHYAL